MGEDADQNGLISRAVEKLFSDAAVREESGWSHRIQVTRCMNAITCPNATVEQSTRVK